MLPLVHLHDFLSLRLGVRAVDARSAARRSIGDPEKRMLLVHVMRIHEGVSCRGSWTMNA